MCKSDFPHLRTQTAAKDKPNKLVASNNLKFQWKARATYAVNTGENDLFYYAFIPHLSTWCPGVVSKVKLPEYNGNDCEFTNTF